MDLFAGLDDATRDMKREQIIKAPFNYPGGKTKSYARILNHLPYRKSYVEPFGGSAAILLARSISDLEVYNDRYSGVVDFYRCVRDPVLFNKLYDRLTLVLHAREEFRLGKETWQATSDIVERAALWWTMTVESFIGKGVAFARPTNTKMINVIASKIKNFDLVHNRLRNVLIENQDWSQILRDFDSSDAVFYLDPPYLEVYKGLYKHEMSTSDHKCMLDMVMNMKGFVAVSGYACELYDSYDWDERIEYETLSSAENKWKGEGYESSGKVKEVLWIKD